MKQIMKNTEIELINNEFEINEAKNLLMQLIQDKINFHVSKNFSQLERLGKIDAISAMKIETLTAEKEKIKKLLESITDQSSKVEINATINISFK